MTSVTTRHRALFSPRSGVTLLELLVVLALGGIVAAAVGGVLAAQLRVARAAVDRAASADALRTTWNVIGYEVASSAAEDVRAVSADSLAPRVFRGTGVVCGTEPGRAHVLYQGDRVPDATKDSVLAISSDGTTRAALLLDVAASGQCAPEPGDSRIPLTLRTSPGLPDAALLLFFESGSYYLTSRALRYRLGAEGRQPLTPELFQNARTAFAAAADGFSMRVVTNRGDSLTRHLRLQ